MTEELPLYQIPGDEEELAGLIEDATEPDEGTFIVTVDYTVMDREGDPEAEYHLVTYDGMWFNREKDRPGYLATRVFLDMKNGDQIGLTIASKAPLTTEAVEPLLEPLLIGLHEVLDEVKVSSKVNGLDIIQEA